LACDRSRKRIEFRVGFREGLLLQAFGAGYPFVRNLSAFYAVAMAFGFIYAGVMPLAAA
jgi:hypothetical protein